MLLFCPQCSNMLIITPIPKSQLPTTDRTTENQNRFECRTCPYQMLLDKAYFERREFEHEEIDSILGGAGAWDGVDKTETKCQNEKCDSRQAYFKQMQTRSADEPMTQIYRCVKCSHEWREG